MNEEELRKDKIFEIEMILYDEFNDEGCSINEWMGEIYTHQDMKDLEMAELQRCKELSYAAIKEFQEKINNVIKFIKKCACYDEKDKECKCGFSSMALDKVIKMLEENKNE